MATWASRRKMTYLGFALTIFLLIVVVPLFFVFYEAPTCSDNIQNQDEAGVDCGGSCLKLCRSNVLAPAILWVRPFKVADGVYNSAAYITNPNLGSGVKQAPYRFLLYDRNNILIAERRGVAAIPPGTTFPIFEGGIETGAQDPTRAQFEFVSFLNWEKFPENEREIAVTSKRFDPETNRVEADIENKGTHQIFNVVVTAVLFDAADNAITASQTQVDAIGKGDSAHVVFTWPQKISVPVVKIDVIPERPVAR